MQPSSALKIGAAFNLLTGIVLLAVPGRALAAFGVSPPPFALVPTRDAGTVLIGLGIIDWLARDAKGAALRGILWGNIFVRVTAMAVNGWEIYTGQIPNPSRAVVAGAVSGNIAIIALFGSALRRA